LTAQTQTISLNGYGVDLEQKLFARPKRKVALHMMNYGWRHVPWVPIMAQLVAYLPAWQEKRGLLCKQGVKQAAK